MSMSFRTLLGAAALVAMSIGGASAATVSLVNGSDQGATNTAGIDYAVGYGANTPDGALWSADPTWSPPPGNQNVIAQSPFNSNILTDTQNYFSVGETGEGGGTPSPVWLDFDTVQTGFDFLWGSIDSYNTLTFLLGGASVASFTGDDIAALFGLTPTSNPNYEKVALLHFTDFGEGFDGIMFASSVNAFEFALAPVPLPATGLLLLGALGALGALRRRRNMVG